jgi:hypothetical protein
MFRLVSARRVAVALAVGAVLGLAGTAAAGDQVPFKGGLDGDVTVTGAPPTLHADVGATGQATQLGRYTVDIPHLVDVRFGTATGTYTFTAANGDKVYATFTGTATPTATPGVLYIEETATITGGTGRFAGATGSFSVERWYDMVALTTVGSFEGTIATPGN